MADTLAGLLTELEEEISTAIPGVNTLDELQRNIRRLTQAQASAIGNLIVDITVLELDRINDGMSNLGNGLADRIEESADSIIGYTQRSETNIRDTILRSSQVTYDKLESLETSLLGFTEGFSDMSEALIDSFGENIEMLSDEVVFAIEAQEQALIDEIQASSGKILDVFELLPNSIDNLSEQISSTIEKGDEMLVEATNLQTKVLDKRLDKIGELFEQSIEDSSKRIVKALDTQTAALVGAEAAQTIAQVAALESIALAITTSSAAQVGASTALKTLIATTIAGFTAWVAEHLLPEGYKLEDLIGEIASEINVAMFNVGKEVYEDFDRKVP